MLPWPPQHGRVPAVPLLLALPYGLWRAAFIAYTLLHTALASRSLDLPLVGTVLSPAHLCTTAYLSMYNCVCVRGWVYGCQRIQ